MRWAWVRGRRARLEAEIRRLELLAAVGDAVAAGRDFDIAARHLLDVLVPAAADQAVLDVVEEDGAMRRVAVRWSGPEREQVEEAVMARAPQPVGLGHTASTGKPQALLLTDDMLREAALDDDDLAFLRSLDIRSALAVPMVVAGRTVGALGLARVARRAPFGPADIRFAEVAASRAGLGLENARLVRRLRANETELTGILEGLADAVHVHGPDGRAVYANHAAAALIGVPSREDVVDAEPGELAARFEITREDGTRVELEDFPGRRIFRGELAPPPLLARSVDRRTGAETWSLTKATAVLGSDGEPLLAVNVIEDVTESKRAELASRLLAQAGEVLGASLDPDTTLARLAVLAVPRLADWCAVDVPGATPGHAIELVAVAHVEPEKVELGYELRRRYPVSIQEPGGLAAVLRGEQAVVQLDVADADVEAYAHDAAHLELLRAVGFRQVLIVAMRVAGEVVGALTFVRGAGRAAFTRDEVALAEELARRAGTAVLNARLYRARGEVAQELQRTLLPRALPEVAGLPMRAHYRAAGIGTDVGGDFYDAFQVPDGWLVVIGDVTGKGAAAAALTGLARSAFEAVATLTGRPDLAIGHLNELLVKHGELALCSVAAVHVRTGGATPVAVVLCAGHPPPLLVRDGTVTAVGRTGPLLGAFLEGTWPPDEVALWPGDVLVLRTDGVTDAVGAEGRLGEDRLRAALAGLAAGDVDDAVARVRDAVEGHEVGAPRDDVAVVAIGVTGVVGDDDGGARAPVPMLAAVVERLELDGTPASVGRAREAVDRHLGERVAGATLSDVRLLVSELASNAVKHAAGAPYLLELDLDARRLRVAVADHGPGFAARDERGRRVPGAALAEGGYGLRIVERLASRWGVERSEVPGGAAGIVTRVWFEVDRPPR